MRCKKFIFEDNHFEQELQSQGLWQFLLWKQKKVKDLTLILLYQFHEVTIADIHPGSQHFL
ncbi:hypothetical protein ACOJQI_11790 [Bacillus salacetis]|uniref:hypothetical protein n=1 Tax=Bacillus salacetis TaxID=2315464 RepID=UPI003BA04012